MIWDLPQSYLWTFGGASIINLAIGVVTGPVAGIWWLTVLQILVNFGLYFVFRALVAKHGVYFMDKLFAHYFSNTFQIVRNNRRTENIIKGNTRVNE